MSTTTTTIATTSTSPGKELLPGFEIRPLTRAHLDWIKAIITHSNIFGNPVWSAVLAGQNRTAIAYQMFTLSDYVVEHALASGLSHGIFDTAYTCKRPESAETGGKLYWDPNDLEASGDVLIEQMDFPLVSVALAYDGFHAMDPAKLGAVGFLPGFGLVLQELEVRDERDPESWKPTGLGQVVYRNSTSTRADYMGRGLMKKQAHALMRIAAEKGFRAVKIECFNEILPRVWANPPSPFRGKVVSKVHTTEVVAVDEKGEKKYLLSAAHQTLSRVWVDLV